MNDLIISDFEKYKTQPQPLSLSRTTSTPSASGTGSRGGGGGGIVILDGMACVGGNTISFAQDHRFLKVISNEFNENRYAMLVHNVHQVMGLRQVEIHHSSILHLAVSNLRNQYDIVFLDPEWGEKTLKHF